MNASLETTARRMRVALGTFVEIGLDMPGNPHGAIDGAFDEIERLEALLSFQRPDSELSRLNRNPGTWITLSASTLRMLFLARLFTAASGGRFDCTLGGECVNRGVLPDHGPGTMLARGHFSDIEIRGRDARLRRPVRITLDGIAKGFAVDRAVAVLKRSGVRGGWVNAGGDLRMFGDCAAPIVQRQPDGRRVPLGLLRGAALGTSHIGCAPSTAYPGLIVGREANAATRPQAISVLARMAWRADALTKVAANTPVEARAAVVAALGGRLVMDVVACAA